LIAQKNPATFSQAFCAHPGKAGRGMTLGPQFKYKVLVSADASLIGKLSNEAKKCSDRRERLLEITSEGGLFSFADAGPATLFVIYCKIYDANIILKEWPTE
jgi:hypothetical protein